MLGISTPHGDGVAQLAFFGLFALQHRGQEAAGIAVSDGQRARLHKDAGLVANVFTPRDAGAAHRLPRHRPHPLLDDRRRTPSATSSRSSSRRCTARWRVAHNGNLVNATGAARRAARPRLRAHRHERHRGDDADARRRRRPHVGGAPRAHAAGVEGRVLARAAGRRPGDRRARPVGLPAAVGRPPAARRARRRQRDVRAVDARLRRHRRGPARARSSRCRAPRCAATRRSRRPPQPARCTFEFVYFSRPDSVWDGRNVHHVRQRLGVELASESAVDADVVIPVPDSSIPAAIGYAAASGIPFNDGLIKNRYIGRTFIEPTQDIRDRGVALKFNALAENLAGKRVVMIDDSLVRGTTAGPLVKLVRDAGATEVHVRITCPPITHACHFGVDMGHDGDLMAARLTVEEMREQIGADSLAFLSLEGMMRADRRPSRRLLQRLLHRPLPDRGRGGPGQALVRGGAG